MKKTICYILFSLLVAGFGVGMYFLESFSLRERAGLSCTELKVFFNDSLEFVSEQDIRDCISSKYGPFLGKQLDSIALGRIESILEAQSAIRKCEAWVTEDGALNVSVTQRAPALRFMNGESGFYVDDRGFIFPLHPRYTADVPVVEGSIPINVADGYKGEAPTAEGQRWIMEMIDLTGFINASQRWSNAFREVRVAGNGDIILYPVEGEEIFIFGPPHCIPDKFERVSKYYTHILPAKGNRYGTINIKYNGQIICRTKDM